MVILGFLFSILGANFVVLIRFVTLGSTVMSEGLVVVPPRFVAGSTKPSVVEFPKARSGVMIPGLGGVSDGMLGLVPSVCLLATPRGDAVSFVVKPGNCVIVATLRGWSKAMVLNL